MKKIQKNKKWRKCLKKIKMQKNKKMKCLRNDEKHRKIKNEGKFLKKDEKDIER